MEAKNILIADDDSSIRNILSKTLQKEGYQVFAASNGKEAVAIAQSTPIRLAILDVEMPVLNGIDALKRIKALDKDIEVLILTGHGNLDNLRQSFVGNGAFDYILKPFYRDEILHAVKNALIRQNLTDQTNLFEEQIKDRISQLEEDFRERTRQLRESQIKYQEIIENSNDLILVVQDGKIRFANNKALELTGFSRVEFSDLSFTDLICPEDQKILNEAIPIGKETKSAPDSSEFRLLKKNGEFFWVETNSNHTVWEGKPAILCFVRDISARKKAEEALKVSQQKYKDLVQKAGSIIIKFDVKGQITFANRFAQEFFGYTKGEIIDQPVVGTIVPENDSSGRDLKAMINNMIHNPGNYTNNEYENIRKDGKRVWITWSNQAILNSKGHIVEILSIGQDKTEQKRAEEELQKAHLEMNHLVSSLSSILIGLSPDNRINRWNLEAEKTLKHKAESVLGKNLAKLDIQWDWNKVNNGVIKCQRQNRPVQVDEVPFIRKDGKEGFLGLTMNPINGHSGRFMGVSILGAEVTERKILECQLVQSQKLESIGQLAAGIAHEINTPTQYVGDNILFLKDSFDQLIKLKNMYQDFLTASKSGDVSEDLIQSVEAICEEIDLKFLMEEIPVAIEQTQEGVGRIAKIVRAMKEFSHPGCEEKTAIDINKAIENTITVARNEWKYVSEMVTDFDPEMPFVPCLPGEFNQVILNIVINAAHAIGDVVGDGSEKKGTITISTHRKGDWAEIRIKDTGAGIPEKIRSRIFDPFFTTKTVGKGTGQGLAISHSVIVDKHGGSLSFESEIGKGTNFIIRLPISNDSGK